MFKVYGPLIKIIPEFSSGKYDSRGRSCPISIKETIFFTIICWTWRKQSHCTAWGKNVSYFLNTQILVLTLF